MKTDHEEYRVSPLESAMKYFGALLVVAYVMVGLGMLVRPDGLFDIPPTWALPLGSMLVVYGVYRGYRFYQKYFR